MALTQQQIYDGLSTIYPEGFKGFDPKKPSPENYQEYRACVMEGYTIHTEATLRNGADQVANERTARAEKRTEFREISESLKELRPKDRCLIEPMWQSVTTEFIAGNIETAAELVDYCGSSAPVTFLDAQFKAARSRISAAIRALK